MKEDLRLRFFEEDDLYFLEKYYVSSTGAPFNKKIWKWKYQNNYANIGKTPAFVCTDRSGEFIGCIQSTQNIKKYRGEVFHCTIGSDAFVRPEYRGKGIYTKIANFLLDSKDQLGSMRFSFYNELTKGASTSAPILMETSVNMNILKPEKVTAAFFSSPLNSSLASLIYQIISNKKKKQSGVRLVEAEPFELAEFYHTWENDCDVVHTPRTEEHIRWRFKDCPYGKSKLYLIYKTEDLVGYIVTVREKEYQGLPIDTVIISDYLISANETSIFRDSVRKLMDLNDDTDLILTRAFSNKGYQEVLTDLGFLDSMKLPLSLIIKPGGVGLRTYDPRCEGLKDKTWYLTEADCF
jgi:hypothetical protein